MSVSCLKILNLYSHSGKMLNFMCCKSETLRVIKLNGLQL